MTSEPDSKPGRRPPTIELTATEVEKPASTEKNSATEPPGERAAGRDAPGPKAAPQASGSRGGRLKSHAMSAVIGAIVMAAIAGGLWIAGYVPSREVAAPPNASSPGAATPVAAAPNVTASKEISARLDKIEQAIQAQRPEPPLGNRMAAAEAETKSLGNSLAALNQRVDDIAAASQTAAKQADAAAAAADAAKSANQANVQHSDIDALASRIAALESAVKALADDLARPASGADDQAARLTVAAEALRAAVERGVPYQAELTAVRSLGVEQNAIVPLEPFAASGVPGAAALAHELAALIPALQRGSEPASGEAGFLGRLEANAQKLVRITPVDAPAGNDPSAVVARIDIDAARADIAAALTDIAALPDAAKPIAADWMKKAEAHEAAVTASRQIAAGALAALGKPAVQ